MSELDDIKNQIVEQFHPQCILLFGSQARGTATRQSDIDLCIVAKTTDKRRLLTDLYYQIDANTPIDFILYTPDEWEYSIRDPFSFAYKIQREGLALYGGQFEIPRLVRESQA